MDIASTRSDGLTTFGVELFTSGDYEAETDYRVSPTGNYIFLRHIQHGTCPLDFLQHSL